MRNLVVAVMVALLAVVPLMATGATPPPRPWGGPEASPHHYRYLDSTSDVPLAPPFVWASLVAAAPVVPGTNAAGGLADDEFSTTCLPLGFTFHSFGMALSCVWVNSNGFVAATNAGTANDWKTTHYLGGGSPAVVHPVAAGFWADLDPSFCGSVVHWQVRGSAPDRTFVVEYDNVLVHPIQQVAVTCTLDAALDPTLTPRATFQILLHESTDDVDVQLLDVHTGTSVSVFAPWTDSGLQGPTSVIGVESATGQYGLTYDGGVGRSYSHVAVRLYPNHSPHVVNDDVVVLEDHPTDLAPGANDVDIDGDPIVVQACGPTRLTFAAPFCNGQTQFTFIPAANVFGNETFPVTVADQIYYYPTPVSAETVTVHILPVNDAPTFNHEPQDLQVAEDSGATSEPGWVTGVSPGPANEASQHVDVRVATDQPGLFAVPPAVDAQGTLTFTPAPDAAGDTILTITAQDDGGTANGGLDTATATVALHVTPVNDAPSLVPGGDVKVRKDSGAQAIAWASGIVAGPANEAAQHLTIVTTTDNPGLFSSQPSLSADGTLRFQSARHATGQAAVTVTLHDDGGTADGGIDAATYTFTITVTAGRA